MFQGFRRRRGSIDASSLSELLGDEAGCLERYASRRGLGAVEALRELVRKGCRYAELEAMYGDPSSHREIWDKRWYYLGVEAAYLNCRLRMRDVMNDLRSLVMSFSSVVAELEAMYKREGRLDGVAKAHLERLKSLVDYYMETYVHSLRRSLEEGGEEEPRLEDVVRSIEEALEKYKRLVSEGENSGAGLGGGEGD